MTEETNNPTTYLVQEFKKAAQDIIDDTFGSSYAFFSRDNRLQDATDRLVGLMERIGLAARSLPEKEKEKINLTVHDSADAVIKAINEGTGRLGHTEAEKRSLPQIQQETHKAKKKIFFTYHDMKRGMSDEKDSTEAQLRFAFNLAQQHKRAASAVIQSIQNGGANYDAAINNVANLKGEIDLAAENLPLYESTLLRSARTNTERMTQAIEAKAKKDIAKIIGAAAPSSNI